MAKPTLQDAIKTLRAHAAALRPDHVIARAVHVVLSERAAPPEVAEQHDYVSTACVHDEHGQCRRTCKFCERPCRCACHVKEEQRG